MVQVAGPIVSLDLTGLRCPYLARRVRKALSRASVGDHIEFVCEDPLASIDIPHLMATLGDQLITQTSSGGRLGFVVRRRNRSSP